MTPVPFYYDWTFWTAVVALLALVLSQLPPLYVLFSPGRLELEAFDRIQVTHWMGKPNAVLHIILMNTGGHGIKVKSLSLAFKPENGDEFTLQGRGYFQSPADQSAVLLTSFRLSALGEWKHIVNFFAPSSRTEERELDQIKSAIRNNIVPRKALPGNRDVFLEATPDLVTPAHNFFRREFRWNPGEYEVTLHIRAEPERASIERKFRITIFESDTAQLRDYTACYKYGAGVYYTDTDLVPVFLPLIPM